MMYVASNLDLLEVPDGLYALGDTVWVGETLYYRLGVPFYGWLCGRMAAATEARDAGDLPAAAWRELSERFWAFYRTWRRST
jgi:hypothetical protein